MLVLLGILLCASMVQSSGLDKALVIIELNTHYREAQVKRLEARVGVLEKERSENETTIRIHTGLFATCSANLNNEIGKNEKLRAKVDKLKDKVQKLKMTVQKFQSKKDKPSAIIST